MPSKPIRYVHCPLCGWTHTAWSRRKAKPFGFENTPINETPLLEWKRSLGHPKEGPSGFETVSTMTIEQALENPTTRGFVLEMYERMEEIMGVIERWHEENEY